MSKLLVIMIDGVSADHYQTERASLPHLASIEARGFRVHNLHAEVVGTSLPGRTSILTGMTADVSGIYGNRIWDGGRFRYPNPDDVRVPTLPARARAAGKDTAVIGLGMVRPEDADIFRAPWWVTAFVQRARDSEPQPADHAWLRAVFHEPGERFERVMQQACLPIGYPVFDFKSEADRSTFALMCDFRMLDWVSALAAHPESPDLIMTEFLTPDSIQHYTGYKSEQSKFTVMQSDMAVGRVLARLQAANVLDEWNIAVMSDHGHSVIEKALYPHVIIPGVQTQCEGSVLLVAPKDAEELAMVTERLAAFGVEPYPNTCIVPEYREQVYLFVAPERVAFEEEGGEDGSPTGAPKLTSSHGLRPGLPGDDRFALFAGPNVPRGHVESAEAAQVAPTLAKILGLPLDDFPLSPVF